SDLRSPRKTFRVVVFRFVFIADENSGNGCGQTEQILPQERQDFFSTTVRARIEQEPDPAELSPRAQRCGSMAMGQRPDRFRPRDFAGQKIVQRSERDSRAGRNRERLNLSAEILQVAGCRRWIQM